MPNLRDRRASTRYATALAAAAALLAAGACAGPDGVHDDGRPAVLTTFTVLADMTRNVAGGHIRVESVTRPGAEIHTYEPTPSDLVRGAGADLLLDNGLGLEGWLAQFSERVEAPTATLSEGVETIPIAAGAHRGAPNPHAWMSPDNALVYVDNIAAALSDLDPAHARDYAANAADYKERIRAIGEDLRADLEQVPPDRRALVTCEGAFSYLARDAGLAERYLWPVNADNEGTPQQVAAAVEFVSARDVPTVFCESTVNDGAQRRVAAETGARLGRPLYVDSLSGPDGPVPTYLDLLRHDTEAIADGLTREETL
ncbi:metal ABC transporter substrate-binding protein [Streptomonospora nanhaiensis]|uniref:metal ABC transporter substrate-binding protein n=1 Tax=Streptomonospora nanhaiensis TaxID=1323731 RepID=UPI0015CDBFEE|nr:metal ABC transporter substrate-binding protein [Streptomonospora nanhaiensis]MBV2366774.1 metal ABC transporter substrate-binding protein [Streptomonospora nanhaiensis]MBX9391056.1 metal ABC transporter substrate-binding protein [Streptomonospora nanhaiensis]